MAARGLPTRSSSPVPRSSSPRAASPIGLLASGRSSSPSGRSASPPFTSPVRNTSPTNLAAFGRPLTSSGPVATPQDVTIGGQLGVRGWTRVQGGCGYQMKRPKELAGQFCNRPVVPGTSYCNISGHSHQETTEVAPLPSLPTRSSSPVRVPGSSVGSGFLQRLEVLKSGDALDVTNIDEFGVGTLIAPYPHQRLGQTSSVYVVNLELPSGIKTLFVRGTPSVALKSLIHVKGLVNEPYKSVIERSISFLTGGSGASFQTGPRLGVRGYTHVDNGCIYQMKRPAAQADMYCNNLVVPGTSYCKSHSHHVDASGSASTLQPPSKEYEYLTTRIDDLTTQLKNYTRNTLSESDRIDRVNDFAKVNTALDKISAIITGLHVSDTH